jgi:NTE family protein
MPEELQPAPPLEADAPVTAAPESDQLEEGIALCLSGGGYRAMLFHLGTLWRLNEGGYLARLNRVSSVSGGSITAGVLALNWNRLGVKPGAPAPGFVEHVAAPVRRMGSNTIDIGSVFEGVFGPGNVARRIQDAYDDELFHGATLQDLPDEPRFVINATNVQSAVLWRFSKPYMRDWRVGKVSNPRVPLALAVAASSAFPPVLSPCELDLEKYGCTVEPNSGADLEREPFTKKAVLTDGGVYDNLGLETAYKRYRTLLVSDGGGSITPEEEPHRDWARHSFRILNVIDSQVRALRKRQLIAAFQRQDRTGAYWGIRSDIADYGVADAIGCDYKKTLALAQTPTRLKSLPAETQELLINWGYAVCDAAMRAYVEPELAAPKSLPYPTRRLW